MPSDTPRPRLVGLTLPQQLLVAAFLVSAVVYLGWRAGSFNPDAPVFSALLYAAELFGFATALLHLFMTWRLTERTAPPPRPGLTVDVFVPTLNEPPELVRRTLLAALAMDYPHRTWLLDDGDRPEMARLALELGCRYLARRDNAHAKAGSLNHALTHSDAEFIALFDCDHAPSRDFLTQTLGYMDDARVAFVQTPQDFYNLDSFQHRRLRGGRIWTEQSLFFRVIQRGKDRSNAAFFCGSCALMRRSALDAIGGFATDTITEDLHTSIRLHKAGWRSVYHARSLAFGVAPQTIRPFLRQRIRWGQGAMQVWRKEGVLTARGLTPAQRLNYLASMMTYFEGWQKALLYASPVVVLTTGLSPIGSFGDEFLVRFIPYFVLTFWVFEESGRGYGGALMAEHYNFARFWAFAWATVAALRGRLRFAVTAKSTGSASHRRWIAPQVAVVVASAIAVPVGLTLYAAGRLPLDGLVANLAWVGFNAAIALPMLFYAQASALCRRAYYRFPVPLPAMLRIDGAAPALVAVDDVSSAGFRLRDAIAGGVGAGARVSGELLLPSGPLAFDATVMATGGGALGCRFDWTTSAQADRLDGFLYGSDLQWRVGALRESRRTPLEWAADLLHGRRAARADDADWTPAVYAAIDAAGRATRTIGLVGGGKLLAFAPLDTQRLLDATIVGGDGARRQWLSLSSATRHDSADGAVWTYACRANGDAAAAEIDFDWSCAWTEPASAA